MKGGEEKKKKGKARERGGYGGGGKTTTFPQNLVVEPEKQRPLGTPSRRWENNIKMDLQDVN